MLTPKSFQLLTCLELRIPKKWQLHQLARKGRNGGRGFENGNLQYTIKEGSNYVNNMKGLSI